MIDSREYSNTMLRNTAYLFGAAMIYCIVSLVYMLYSAIGEVDESVVDDNTVIYIFRDIVVGDPDEHGCKDILLLPFP